jgi:hypothetical protein
LAKSLSCFDWDVGWPPTPFPQPPPRRGLGARGWALGQEAMISVQQQPVFRFEEELGVTTWQSWNQLSLASTCQSSNELSLASTCQSSNELTLAYHLSIMESTELLPLDNHGIN